jgi:alpha/beta superfamily hydrolase
VRIDLFVVFALHHQARAGRHRLLAELVGSVRRRLCDQGVGASTGAFDNGDGESGDLVAVARWVHQVRPGDALWLAGFSFGSYIALRSARSLGADALITVAPPVGRYEFAELAMPTCPWLVVQGEDDEVVDPQGVFDWIEKLDPKPTLIRMPETGHFFHRRLMDLRGAVKNAVRAWLPR